MGTQFCYALLNWIRQMYLLYEKSLLQDALGCHRGGESHYRFLIGSNPEALQNLRENLRPAHRPNCCGGRRPAPPLALDRDRYDVDHFQAKYVQRVNAWDSGLTLGRLFGLPIHQ